MRFEVAVRARNQKCGRATRKPHERLQGLSSSFSRCFFSRYLWAGVRRARINFGLFEGPFRITERVRNLIYPVQVWQFKVLSISRGSNRCFLSGVGKMRTNTSALTRHTAAWATLRFMLGTDWEDGLVIKVEHKNKKRINVITIFLNFELWNLLFLEIRSETKDAKKNILYRSVSRCEPFL